MTPEKQYMCWSRGLKEPHTKPIYFTGRPKKGYLAVGLDGREDCRTVAQVTHAQADVHIRFDDDETAPSSHAAC